MSVELPYQTIGQVCGPNPGFVRNLWLVDARKVGHIPDPVYQFGNNSLLVPSRLISFFLDPLLFRMKFKNKECTYQEVAASSEAGIRYTQSIQFSISQLNAGHTAWLMNHVHTRWIAFFKDHLGNVRIAGTTALPMTLNFGSQLAADNSTTVSLVCECTHAAWFTDSLPSLQRVFTSAFSENFA